MAPFCRLVLCHCSRADVEKFGALLVPPGEEEEEVGGPWDGYYGHWRHHGVGDGAAEAWQLPVAVVGMDAAPAWQDCEGWAVVCSSGSGGAWAEG